MTGQQERCENCRFWRQVDEAGTPNPLGQCRRGLRQVPVEDDDWKWPIHDSLDWCGEWRELEAADKLLGSARRLVRLIQLRAPSCVLRNELKILDRLLPPKG